jgi:hypothetical protein
MITKKTLKILSYAIAVLGLIHVIATYTPLIKGGLSCLDKENLNAMLYMSLVCGASFILSGILLLNLLPMLAKHVQLIIAVRIISVFLLASGISAFFYMMNNPFAYLALGICVGIFIFSLLIKAEEKAD